MEKIDVIPLLKLLGVNHHQPLLHMSIMLAYLYTPDKRFNQFSIGYMIKPTLHVNRVLRQQVEKCLRATFNQNTMVGIQNVMRKKDTCVIELIMFYDSKTKNLIKVYRVLSFVLYSVINIYVFIEYIWCQSKN